jgi:hypothetical protein
VPTGVKLKGLTSNDASGCGCSIPSRAAQSGAVTLAAAAIALISRARKRRISRAKAAGAHD